MCKCVCIFVLIGVLIDHSVCLMTYLYEKVFDLGKKKVESTKYTVCMCYNSQIVLFYQYTVVNSS